MILECKYEVQAAHQLTAGVPPGHPCRRLHGHRYNIVVAIEGEVKPETGMILEYAYIDKMVVDGVISYIDHRFLNDLNTVELVGDGGIRGVYERELADAVSKNSTVENLIKWFKAELNHYVLPSDSVKIAFVRIEEDSGHTVQL